MNNSNADDLARFVISERLRSGAHGVGSRQQVADTPDLSAGRSTVTGTSPATGVRMQVRSAMRHDVRGHERVAASVDLAVGRIPPGSTADSAGRATMARPTVGAVVETAQRVRFPSSNPLFVGCPSLFLQTACGPSTLGPAASLVAAEETGILLTLSSRTTALAKALRKAVGECRAIVAAAAQDPSAGHAILVDANRIRQARRRVGLCFGCARWAHRRAVEQADGEREGIGVRGRRVVRTVRAQVMRLGLHDWPLVGSVLRRLDRRLP